MSDVFALVSHILLWGITIGLVVSVFALFRFHGMQILNRRDRRMTQGPDVGRKLPAVLSTAADGRPSMDVGGMTKLPRLYVYTDADCALCKDLLSALGPVAINANGLMEAVVVVRGSNGTTGAQIVAISDRIMVAKDPRGNVTRSHRISATPFVIVADPEGKVLAKGSPRRERDLLALLETAGLQTAPRMVAQLS
jgi:hypothetical protein